MNLKLPLFALIATSSLAVSAPALAQDVTNLPTDSKQSAGVEAGFESAFIARASYAHRLPEFLPDAMLYARFTLPLAEPDFGDIAVDAGVRATVLGSGNWKLELLLGPELHTTSNEMFSAAALGVRSTVLGGYKGDSWGLLGEIGYDQTLTTHLTHSDLYRRTAYAGAKDGWYATTGGTWHAGLRSGARIDRAELFASAGAVTSAHFNAMMPPFYATIGGNYAF